MQHPVGQAVQQRAVGLQLEAEFRETAHNAFHHGPVQRRFTAIESDIDLLVAQVLVNEGCELVDVVFQLGLGAENLAHAQRAIAAFQVALEGGEEL